MLDMDVGGSFSLYTRRETCMLIADGNLINKWWKEIEPSVKEHKVFAQMPATSDKGEQERKSALP